MRFEKLIILILLGIISVSSFTSLLTNYVPKVSSLVRLDSVTSSVGYGNFSYWKLNYEGPLIIALTSISGDADLYVSDNERPSYEGDRNNLSSTTCGLDVVHISAEFPRPIGVGVFGHWSHELSEYNIQVFLDTDEIQEQIRDIVDKLSSQHDEPELEARLESRSSEQSRESVRNVFRSIVNIVCMALDLAQFF